jgi:hypothetical protein
VDGLHFRLRVVFVGVHMRVFDIQPHGLLVSRSEDFYGDVIPPSMMYTGILFSRLDLATHHVVITRT